ncbi:hypothetical protein JYQ62_16190 [Nostoc sp. UHCC 0702]|nr:hypothetical protein JYQ62_16190 [Nostoc sp. UHCC 0702]
MFKEGQLVKVKNTSALAGFIGTVKITTTIGALIFFPALGYTNYVFFADLELVVNSDTKN